MISAVAGPSSSPSQWTYIKRQSRVTVARSRKPTVPLTSIVEETAVASVAEEPVSVCVVDKSAPACILEEDYLPSHSSPGLEAPTSALPDVPPPQTSKTQPQTRSRSRSVKARRRLGVSDLSPLSLFAASASSASTSASAFPSSPSRSPSGSLRFPASPTGSFLSQSPVHTPSRSPFFTPVLTTDADWRLTLAADSSSNSDSNSNSDSEPEDSCRRTRTRTLDFPRPPTVSFDAFGFDFALDSDSDADPDTDSSYSPSHSSSAHSNSPSSGSDGSDGSASPTSSGAPTTPSPSPTADTYAAAAAQSHSPALHVQELPFTNAGRIGVVRCKSIKPLTITKRAVSPMPSVPVASTSASSSPAAPTRALPASPALTPVLLPPVGQEQAAETAADVVVEEPVVEIEEAQEHEEDDASSWEDDDDFYAAHARGYITLAPPLPASFPALLSPALSSYASTSSAAASTSKSANRESSILPTGLNNAHRMSRRLSRPMPIAILTSSSSPAHSRSGSSTSIKTIGGGGVVPNFSRPTSLAHRRTGSASSTVQVPPSPVVEGEEESTAERAAVVEDSVSVEDTQKMVQEEERVMEGEKVASKSDGSRPKRRTRPPPRTPLPTSMCVMSGDYSYAADYAAYAPLLMEPGMPRCDSPRTATAELADSPSSSSRLDALLSPPPAPRPLSPRTPRTASVPVDVGDEWEDELSSYYHDVPLSPLVAPAPTSSCPSPIDGAEDSPSPIEFAPAVPLPLDNADEDEESPIEFAPPHNAILRTTSPLPSKAEERSPRNRIDALTAAMTAATPTPTPAPYTGWHPRPRASQLRLLAASSEPIAFGSRSQCSTEEQTPATPATPFTPAYTTSPSSYSPHAYSPTQPLRSRWSSSTLSSVHSARSSTAHGHGHARSPKTFAFARRYFPKTRVGATSASSTGNRTSSNGTRTPKPHPKPMGSATVLRNSPFPSLARSMSPKRAASPAPAAFSPTSPAMPAAFRRGMSPKRKGKKLTAADVMTPHLSIGAADMTVGRPPAGASVLAMASVLAGVEDPFASPTSVRSPQAQWAAYPASLSRASSGAWSTASSGDGSDSDTSVESGGSTRRRKPIPVGLFLR